jgi:hypothetical protein
MSVTLQELETKTDRQLECLFATIIYHTEPAKEFEVRGEFLCDSVARQDEDPSVRGRPVPRYVTTWDGFSEALSRIDRNNFNVEIYCPADRTLHPRAVVSQRLDEVRTRKEASHHNLRRALVIAAVLAMYGPIYGYQCLGYGNQDW